MFLISVIFAAISVSEVAAAGIRCYVCTNVDKPQDCHRIGECSGDQQCHIRYYTNTLGFQVYDLGCQAKSFCDYVSSRAGRREAGMKRQSNVVWWNRCCNTDYCNIDFDDQGNTTHHKGLRCFNCEHVTDPAECDTVITCEEGDACFTHEKTSTLGQHGFGMSCKSKKICEKIPAQLTLDHHHSRSLELCQGCCDVQSHCNTYFCSKYFSPTNIPPIEATTPAPFLNVSASPSSQTVLPGSTAVFRCEAYGYPNVNVTWLFSHANLSTFHIITVGVTPTITGSELAVYNVTDNDLGHYVCMANNQNISQSSEVVLDFKEFLNITMGPSTTSSLHGGNATFSCDAIGSPHPSITWFFTNTLTANLSVISTGVTTTPTGSKLTVFNVTDGDLGTYVCYAVNGVEKLHEQAQLLYEGKPKITLKPHSQNVTQNLRVDLPCKADGEPRPKITWSFVSTTGVTQLASGVSISLDKALVITHMRRDHVGNYTCTAKNAVGTDTATATITVNPSK